MKKLWLVILIFFCFYSPAETAHLKSKSSDFLRAEGTKLFLNGKEFKAISFNKFDLIYQYLELPNLGKNGNPDAGRQSLRQLHKQGFNIILITLAPYSETDFKNWFFDDNQKAQEEKRKRFFAVMDRMLQDCKENEIMVVGCLWWNISNLSKFGGHSLNQAFANPFSRGYLKFVEFTMEVVKRYHNSPTIAMWEPGCEYDLMANLQRPNGVLANGKFGKDDNFTSGELANFYRRVFSLIRSLDPNHLVTTGASNFSLSEMHLYRAASVHSGKPDWTKDTPEEREQHIRLLEENADVMQVHFYDNDPEKLRWYVNVARRMNKPLFLAELGGSAKTPEQYYVLPQSHKFICNMLQVIFEEQIPISLFWTYDPYEAWLKNSRTYCFWPGATDKAIKIIEKANKEYKKRSQ